MKLKNDINALKKQLMFMETYFRRENLKSFGLPENTDVSYGRNNKEEGSSRQHGDPENTKIFFYKTLEGHLKIDRPRDKIGFQQVHRLGRPSLLRSLPIITGFLRNTPTESSS